MAVTGYRNGCAISFYLNTGQSFVANGYTGIAGDGSSTLAANVCPFVVPAPGIIKYLRVFGLANTPGSVTCAIYRSARAVSPSYSTTGLTVTLSTTTFDGGDTTHTYRVVAGDLLVGFTSAAWSANGGAISCLYIPDIV